MGDARIVPVIDRWLPRLLLAAGFLLLLALCTRQAGSLDAGFHLKAGEWILAGNGWPRTDPFTYTINDHEWIDTSWGYQVMVALAQRAAGPEGLVLLHVAVISAVFLTIAKTAFSTKASALILGLVLPLGVIASEMRFEIRPEAFSWLLLAAVLHVLHRHAEGRRMPLWILPAIHLIWVNVHSLFILGWAAIACFVAGEWFKRREFPGRLAGAGLVSVLITLVNPYGWRGAVFPFTLASRLSDRNLFGQSIGEFVSPFDLGLSSVFPFYPRAPIFAFRLFAVLAVISMIVLARRKRYSAALLTLPFAALSAMMIRNIPLLIVACLPGVATALTPQNARPAGRVRGVRLARVAQIMALLGCLGATLRVVNDGWYIASRRPERFGLSWNRLSLPIDAAAYASRAGLSAPMLNHLNFGGFLMWARPQPVFIDGRLELTGEKFYRDYLDALGSEASLEARVARHGIGWIVFPYATSPRLLARLSRDSRWELAYVDHLAVIFTRKGVEPAARALFADAMTPPVVGGGGSPGIGGAPRASASAHWLRGFARREVFPSASYYRGIFHYFRGEHDAALAWFSAALRESDGAYYEVYNNLGAVFHHLGRRAEAAECYRIVLQHDPGNRVARERIQEGGSL